MHSVGVFGGYSEATIAGKDKRQETADGTSWQRNATNRNAMSDELL
jgi:hypothetical protein